MREIKFRCYDGLMKQMLDAERLKITICNNKLGYIWYQQSANSAFGSSGFYLDQDRYRLMQYTGLKDKQGKEIYEGDIVTIRVKENIGTFNVPDDIIANGGYTGREDVYEGEVVFKDFGFGVDDKESGIIFLQPIEDTFFEVIGNIYENPEIAKTMGIEEGGK